MELNTAEIGKRILRLRNSKKYSRQYLAEQVGISEKFLYEIESGKRNFSAFVLCNLSTVLGASCEYIMFGNNDEKINPLVFPTYDEYTKDDVCNLIELLACVAKFKNK